MINNSHDSTEELLLLSSDSSFIFKFATELKFFIPPSPIPKFISSIMSLLRRCSTIDSITVLLRLRAFFNRFYRSSYTRCIDIMPNLYEL